MSENKYPELPEDMTIGESYAPAMEIDNKENAQQYLERLIERDMRYHGLSREEALHVNLSNIGYYAGYYSSETAQRVYRLFNTTHPIFGGREVTAEEAFQAGIDAANE